jgi:hypothetical protein
MTSTPSSANSPGGRLRASDAEREEIATIVREAVGEGRLDMGEGDARLATLYAAKYRDELGPIVNDLPAGQAWQRQAAGGSEDPRGQWAPGPWGRGPWGPGGREHGHSHGRGWPRRGYFRAHLGLVVMIALALTGLWALTGAHFFWPAIPLIFLTLGLVRHWRWAAWSRRW